MKQIQKIDKKKAKKDIISALDEYENIILLGFKPTGEAALITATDDEIYDKLGLAIMVFLKGLAKEVEED